MRTLRLPLLACTLVAAALVDAPLPARAASPITHVVIIDEENHSFDDVLGKLCVEQAQGTVVRAGLNMACDGTDTGVLANGTAYPLTLEPDFGLKIGHGAGAQRTAIDGGKMDGFSKIPGCTATSTPPYGCLSQYDPLKGTCGPAGTETCIPNTSRLAENFAISDRTFEFHTNLSWAAHMILASATIQHFHDGTPNPTPGVTTGPGWGCDSGKVIQWSVGGQLASIPSCIPDQAGNMGPLWSTYTGTKAAYVPTLFDRMDGAGITWRIYGGLGQAGGGGSGYAWTICPTFFECLGGTQHANLVPASQIITDAAAGTLPNVSFVTPTNANSAHPPQAMSAGDNWIGNVVGAIQANQPLWSTTAIFITFDDCGCFYDHVNPLQFSKDWGIREPMLIVSPWAKAGFTDSTPATFVSMLAFVEHTFALQPLNPCASVDSWDPNCTDDVRGPNGTVTYDFAGAFDFSQTPIPPLSLVRTRLPAYERRWLAAHPNAGDQGT